MTNLQRAGVSVLLVGLVAADLHAQQDRLSFGGDATAPGTSIRVAYAPIAPVSDNTLELRARLRRSGDWIGSPTVRLAALHRDGDQFVGAFTWPDSVVMLVLAVAGNGLKRPDTNGGRYWELLAKDGRGKLTAGAMWQRVLDRGDPQRRDWEGSLAAAREFSAAFPNLPEAWFALASTEEIVLGPARKVADANAVAATLVELNTRFASQQDVSQNTAEAFASYWEGRDSTAAAYWSRYVLSHFPNGEFARRARMTPVLRDPQSSSAALDSLWLRERHADVAGAGYRLALQAKDSTKMRMWGTRLAQASPSAMGRVGSDFLAVPELAAEGVRLLEQRWNMLQAEDTTLPPLHMSDSELRNARVQARANAAAALARGVIARGDTSRAKKLYESAASVAWSPRILADAASLAVRLGDTATAVLSYARAAATGTAPATLLTAAEGVIPGLQTRADFQHAFRTTRAEYSALIRENEVSVPIDLNLQVTDSSGHPSTLKDLSAGRPLVLAFWSPYCMPSVAALPEIDALAAAVEAKGGRFISIVSQPPSPDLLAAVAAHKFTRPHFFPGAEIGRALGQWQTPDIYIIDSAGTLRYAHSAPIQARAEFEVLAEVR